MQGLLISVIGTALGLILGYGWLGGRALPLHPSGGGGLLHRLPALCAARRDGVIVAAVSLGVSLLATLYPSAARVLPAEALRYE